MSFQIVRLPDIHENDWIAEQEREVAALKRLQEFFTPTQAHRFLWADAGRRNRLAHIHFCLSATGAELEAWAKKKIIAFCATTREEEIAAYAKAKDEWWG